MLGCLFKNAKNILIKSKSIELMMTNSKLKENILNVELKTK